MASSHVKKQITQETFNDVVCENVNDFDMSPEDAVNDAIQQFEAQGVDLSNIVRILALSNISSDQAYTPRASSVLSDIEKILTSEHEIINEENTVKLDIALKELLDHLNEQDNRALVGARNGFVVILQAIEQLAKKITHQDTLDNRRHLSTALNVLATLLEGQPDLVTPPNPDSVIAEAHSEHLHIQQICRHLNDFKDDPHIQRHGIIAVRHACIKHETNRQTFVAQGVIELLLHCIEYHAENPATVLEAARCLRTLVFDDDIRVAFGKAHEHAKLMVQEHNALKRIMEALKSFMQDVVVCAELCKTLAKLAVRDEYCKEIVEQGGLELLLPALDFYKDNAEVVSATFRFLRAIAGNDDVKAKIREANGINVILDVMSYNVKIQVVQEQGCAALSAICLRCPENGRAIAEANGPHLIVRAMSMFPNYKDLQKYASRVIRNIVSRSPDVKPLFLTENAEHYLNLALAIKECHDDAKAALRDLGCKVMLAEPWKGTKGLPSQ
eukprot:gene5375-7125_t